MDHESKVRAEVERLARLFLDGLSKAGIQARHAKSFWPAFEVLMNQAARADVQADTVAIYLRLEAQELGIATKTAPSRPN